MESGSQETQGGGQGGGGSEWFGEHSKWRLGGETPRICRVQCVCLTEQHGMRTPGTAVSPPAVKPDKQTWVDQVHKLG